MYEQNQQVFVCRIASQTLFEFKENIWKEVTEHHSKELCAQNEYLTVRARGIINTCCFLWFLVLEVALYDEIKMMLSWNWTYAPQIYIQHIRKVWNICLTNCARYSWIYKCCVSLCAEYMLYVVVKIFNPYIPRGPVHPYVLGETLYHLKVFWCLFFSFILCISNRNSCKQTLQTQIRRRVQRLHCLPRSHSWDDWHKWVRSIQIKIKNVFL